MLEIVYYGNLRSKDNSLMHTGDNLTGKGDGDDESIMVDLPSVPPAVAHIVFVVNSFSGQNFIADRERHRPGRRLRGPGPRTGAVRAQWLRIAHGRGDGPAVPDRRRAGPSPPSALPGNARTADQLVPLALQSL